MLGLWNTTAKNSDYRPNLPTVCAKACVACATFDARVVAGVRAACLVFLLFGVAAGIGGSSRFGGWDAGSEAIIATSLLP